MRVDHLRVGRGRVAGTVVTGTYLVPVEIDLDNDPAARAAVEVLQERLERAAIDAAAARLATSKTRLIRTRQRTAEHLAVARRWAS